MDGVVSGRQETAADQNLGCLITAEREAAAIVNQYSKVNTFNKSLHIAKTKEKTRNKINLLEHAQWRCSNWNGVVSGRQETAADQNRAQRALAAMPEAV